MVLDFELEHIPFKFVMLFAIAEETRSCWRRKARISIGSWFHYAWKFWKINWRIYLKVWLESFLEARTFYWFRRRDSKLDILSQVLTIASAQSFEHHHHGSFMEIYLINGSSIDQQLFQASHWTQIWQITKKTASLHIQRSQLRQITNRWMDNCQFRATFQNESFQRQTPQLVRIDLYPSPIQSNLAQNLNQKI